MDKHENDKLKDWLTELTNGEEAPVEDALWAAIAPKIAPPKKKRRFILWWWGCLPLLALGLLVAAGWYWTSFLQPSGSEKAMPPNTALPQEPVTAQLSQKSIDAQQMAHKNSPSDPVSQPVNSSRLRPAKKALRQLMESSGAVHHGLGQAPAAPAENEANNSTLNQDSTINHHSSLQTKDTLPAAFNMPLLTLFDSLPLRYALLSIKQYEASLPAVAKPLTQKQQAKKGDSWHLDLGVLAYSSSLLLQPLRDDLYLIEAVEKDEAKSGGLSASLSIQKRILPHFIWRNQVSGYVERHAADFRLYYLDKPELVSKVLPGNQLLVSITYADSIISSRRNHWGIGLESGLQWHPWKALAHNVYLGGEMRWQERNTGRKWAPVLKCGLEMGLDPKQQLRFVVSGAWQVLAYNDNYFDYVMGHLGLGLRYHW